ncbi:hypothetical protein NDU88_006134 [Pleurodeles waltl]|uniref:Uncharacterized protein n=1 Tax=Pleurodeles waltl TaxID=8319 RepID=A0AAV7MLF8_PLEWA|nr:hypothetical protein NDU88_006134 [Pleurodeles waltl]
MASSGLAVRKLADGVIRIGGLAPMQCGLLEYGRWTAGRVLCPALCGRGGFGLRKLILGFRGCCFHAGNVAVLLDSVPIDSFVASLVGLTSLAEDAVIQASVDKKVDVSLKKAYAGTHLALRAGIYGTYVAQSLLSDLKALISALDGSSDCSGLMSFIQRQLNSYRIFPLMRPYYFRLAYSPYSNEGDEDFGTCG